jgi:hypothetical protein
VRLLTQQLLDHFDLAAARVVLPASVRALYPRELARIAGTLAGDDHAYFALDVDPWIKDYALLTHRLIPFGAEFAEPGAGVPRAPLVTRGLGPALRAAWLIGLRARGLRPYFALHAHPRALEDFSPDGWLASYHRLADLLEANPAVRGITSASWFLDPALAEISPRLAYLRAVPAAGGAEFFLSERDQLGVSGALARSPTRRRLFQEGAYVPEVWLRVWLRQDLLAWSRRERSARGTAA